MVMSTGHGPFARWGLSLLRGGNAAPLGALLLVASVGMTPGHTHAADLVITGGTITVSDAQSYENARVGAVSGDPATLVVTTPGELVTSGDLAVGGDGAGTLTMNGGRVSVGGTLSRGPAGTINLNSGGTLQIGTGGAGGVLGVSSLENNGTLVFNRSDDSTYSGSVNGSGVVIKTGAGTLTLSGANSYSGGTGILAGTVKVDAGGSISHGSAPLYVGFEGGSGALEVNGGSVTSGTGVVGYCGSGTVTVSSGTWAISGDLFVGVDGIGSATGSDDTSDDTSDDSGDLAEGVGGILTMNGGLVSVGGTLSRGTAGTINLNSGGTLQIGTGGSGGVLGVSTLENNGTLIFNRSDDSTYSGSVSGSGVVIKDGTGTLTLSGANSYSGGTTILAGTVKVDAGGSINHGSSPLYVGIEGGSGTLEVNGGSVTNGTGVVGFGGSGTATVSSGTWTTSGDLTVGLPNYSVGGFGTLNVTGGLVSVGGTLGGFGSINVTSSGAVQIGVVDGSLANSAVTVGTGGTLGGWVSIAGLVTVQADGVLSPGRFAGLDGVYAPDNCLGLLTVSEIALLPGSATVMQLVGDGAGGAGYDYDSVTISTAGGLSYGGSLDLDFGNLNDILDGTFFDLFSFTGSPIGHFAFVFTHGSGLYAGRNFSGSDGIWTSTIGNQVLTFSELSGRLTFASVIPDPRGIPEIDPATGGSAFSLVAGVLAIIEQRRRRRTSPGV
jgi:hypothetical protein